MEVAKIKITGADASVSNLETITSGMIGATVSIEYDDSWADLNKQVVFRGPLGVVNAEGAEIPAESLRIAGFELSVGVYGYSDDGSVAVPTVWASLGMIQKGADPEGDEAAKPTLPVWARVLTQIGNLDDLTTEAKNNLVAAINEAAASGGGLDQEQLDEIIERALTEAKESGEFDGETGPQGPQGPQGEPGPTGATPKISIGAVETLEPGSNATATMTGTADNPVLNLGIPRGADGKASEIPYFDLVEMGLPDIIPDTAGTGSFVELTGIGFPDFEAAMEQGKVRIRVAVNTGAGVFHITAVGNPFYSEEYNNWQITTVGVADVRQPPLCVSVLYFPAQCELWGYCSVLTRTTT